MADLIPAVSAEVLAGQESGWKLVAAECSASGVQAAMSKGSGIDDGAIAFVEAAPATGSGAAVTNEWPVQIPVMQWAAAGQPVTDLSVSVEVPHHLDRAWPQSPELEFTASCLSGGASSGADWSWLSGPALDPTAEPVPTGAPVSWSDGSTADLDGAARSMVNDPALSALGVMVAAGDPGQVPIGVSEPLFGGIGLLPDAVTNAVAGGWTLTTTGCVSEGPTWAELHRRVDGDHDAALRIVQVPTAADGAVMTGVVRVSGTMWGAEANRESVDSVCWEHDLEAPFTATGHPSFGPTVIEGA